jgi:signal transduction histidine kinase
MPALLSLGRPVLAALAGYALALLALRFPGCRRRGELARYFLFLSACALAGLSPTAGPLADALALLVPWAAGFYAEGLDHAQSAGQGPRRLAVWTAAVAAAGLASAVPAALGVGRSLPSALFRLFLCQAAALPPLAALARAWRAGREGSMLALLIAFALLSAALGAALLERASLAAGWVRALPLPAACAVLAAGGYRLAQEGYLLAEGWWGALRRAREREGELASARGRLLEAEGSLDLADRAAAAGLVAGGVAHELRSLLGFVQAAAEHGLRQGEPEALAGALRRVLAQVGEARRALGELLEPLARGQEAEPQAVLLPGDLEGLLRLARASFRREGIRLDYSPRPQAGAWARRGELGHVLLTLLANAADSVRQRPAGREVRVRFRSEPGQALLEVGDNGAGVPPSLQGRLFEPGASGKGSTGVGLYLARAIAERNGGSLELVDVPEGEGSLFRLRLPAAPG